MKMSENASFFAKNRLNFFARMREGILLRFLASGRF